MKKPKRRKHVTRKQWDKLTMEVVALFVGFVIDDSDSEALRLLQDCWPEHDWTALIADICLSHSKPLPFAKLLTFPGYQPGWTL